MYYVCGQIKRMAENTTAKMFFFKNLFRSELLCLSGAYRFNGERTRILYN